MPARTITSPSLSAHVSSPPVCARCCAAANQGRLPRHLVENRNRVLSRDRLLERVWGYDRMIETRSVDVHVGRLRAKLGPEGKQIETVVGLGTGLSRLTNELSTH